MRVKGGTYACSRTSTPTSAARASECQKTNRRMRPSCPYQRVAVLATTMLWASIIFPITPPVLFAAPIVFVALTSFMTDDQALTDWQELRSSPGWSRLLAKVAGGVRNIRATNSLVDFCHTLEGHFGACVNLHPRLWDIVPASLMFPEAGGCFTDLEGRALEFDLGPAASERVYPIVGAGAALHPRIIALTRG